MPATPTTSWDYGLHHYDMVWDTSHIRFVIDPALEVWRPLIADILVELEQLIAIDMTIGPAIDDEPRIEFRPLEQTGAPSLDGVLGYAELYVTDDFTIITGGRVGLLDQWQDADFARWILRHEVMHVLGGTRDYSTLDNINPNPEERNPGPVQTVMSYDHAGGGPGFGAADVMWLQTLFGPSPDDDVIHGLAGTGSISGGLGDDLIYGNQGQDWLYGNQGEDILFGGQGDDWIHGGQGDDRLIGGRGNDRLIGGKGDDTLIGGLGQDTIIAQYNDVVVSTADDLVLFV
ncbi:MAG: calcium-binding protein [Pseudomonadota bacterium]